MLIADDAARLDLSAGDEAEEQADRRFFGRERRLGFGTAAELAIDVLDGVGRP